MKKSVEEIISEMEEFHSAFLVNHMNFMGTLLKEIRQLYYDAIVYFGHSVRMIKTFGIDGEVTIPKEIMDIANTGERYRLDQVINEDGSMTIKLVKVEDENSDNNSIPE